MSEMIECDYCGKRHHDGSKAELRCRKKQAELDRKNFDAALAEEEAEEKKP